MDIQVHIPAALAVVHNLICHHEPVEDDETEDEDEDEDEDGPAGGRFDDGDDGNDGADGVVVNEPDARRDVIVSTMWDQYLQEHIDRGLALPGAMEITQTR